MQPGLQVINNLFMLSLLYSIVALLAFGLSKMIRNDDTNPLTPVIDKWTVRVKISFLVLVLFIGFCIMTVFSFITGTREFGYIAGPIFLSSIVIAMFIGFQMDTRLTTKKKKTEK